MRTGQHEDEASSVENDQSKETSNKANTDDVQLESGDKTQPSSSASSSASTSSPSSSASASSNPLITKLKDQLEQAGLKTEGALSDICRLLFVGVVFG